MVKINKPTATLSKSTPSASEAAETITTRDENRAQNEPLNESEANMTGIIAQRPPMSVPLTGLNEETEEEYLDELIDDANQFRHGIIFMKMVDVMNDMEAIVKTKQSSGVQYAFRSIEDVMNAIHPILCKHGVFIVPVGAFTKNKVHPRQNKGPAFQCIYSSNYRFYAIDGSYVEASMVAESIDYSDKATQQASSYCFKNVILQTFCVPTKDVVGDGDDKQPDRTDEEHRKIQQTAQRIADLPKVQRSEPGSDVYDPMKPEEWDAVKAWFAPFKPLGFDKDAFHHWVIKTLRANGLDVPAHLKDLPRKSGLTLIKVAQYCYEIGSTVHMVGQDKDEGDFIILTVLPAPEPIIPSPLPMPTPAHEPPVSDDGLGTDDSL